MTNPQKGTSARDVRVQTSVFSVTFCLRGSLCHSISSTNVLSVQSHRKATFARFVTTYVVLIPLGACLNIFINSLAILFVTVRRDMLWAILAAKNHVKDMSVEPAVARVISLMTVLWRMRDHNMGMGDSVVVDGVLPRRSPVCRFSIFYSP